MIMTSIIIIIIIYFQFSRTRILYAVIIPDILFLDISIVINIYFINLLYRFQCLNQSTVKHEFDIFMEFFILCRSHIYLSVKSLYVYTRFYCVYLESANGMKKTVAVYYLKPTPNETYFNARS